jgi:hypothetical protein
VGSDPKEEEECSHLEKGRRRLRSREGPTYLIGAVAVVLISGGRREGGSASDRTTVSCGAWQAQAGPKSDVAELKALVWFW